ncbi:MAG TPA: competence/damage-inducible protein A, partial [Euzebyales bacterium]|nr:competence/damage-inducible protein A [Euzebyales bacterium]
MIVEVIAVGTELLLGQIVNTNVAVIGTRLADEGFDAHYQVTVGDNLERLAATIRTAIERADAVILTGGIGPTQDDLTREALCAVTGRAMARDEAHAEAIRERIVRIRGHVAESTLRMADHPDGATGLPNRNGVALGIAMEHRGVPIFAVPGVPSEMAVMLDEQVMPRLRRASGEPAV